MTDYSPLLSIITRCCQRPRQLAANIESVSYQTCKDIEQLLLIDWVGRGLRYANEQFYQHREHPRGRYVWMLDDDDQMLDPTFVEKLARVVEEDEPDVVLVKTFHKHTGTVYPQPEIWDLDWEAGERPEYWSGGGYCVIVERNVWLEHLEAYYEGQGDDWSRGGDWHFITELCEADLTFARFDVVAAVQEDRGYGKKTETTDRDWLAQALRDTEVEELMPSVYRIDHARLPVGVRQQDEYVSAPHILLQRPLTILSLAHWDYAGCGYFLSQAIDRYTEHESVAVKWKQSRLDFPNEILDPSLDQLRALWDKADVVHIHDAAINEVRSFPPKPTVITWHGSRYRKAPQKRNRFANRLGWVKTVSTLDLTRHGPEWLPDCRFRPDVEIERTDNFSVCHAPTHRGRKGTKAVVNAGLSCLKLIEHVTWAACIEEKARCHLLIDQFRHGYGCNAIEAWALGMPVIANGYDWVKDRMEAVIGYLPFLLCDEDSVTIREAVMRLKTDESLYQEILERGRRCYLTYHAPQANALIALRFYEKALSKQYEADVAMPVTPDDNELVLLHYLGKNVGRTTWFGESGEQYEFSKGQPYRYVRAEDANTFLRMEHEDTGRRIFELANHWDG